MIEKAQYYFVKYVYGDHNSSRNVKRALTKCFKNLSQDDNILNVGSGETRLHPNIVNLDIYPGESVDVVGTVDDLPFDDKYFKLVISQETIEHVPDPFNAVKEMYRVLDDGGVMYLQVPFIIGYHPGPTDFWRFTKEGIVKVAEDAGFKIEEVKITVGSASGFYRILVEFLSVLFSLPFPFLYKILKAGFALALYFIKLFDFTFVFSKEKDRIPGGYYVIAKKVL